MLLRTTPTPAALIDPELSSVKKARQWQRAGMPGLTREAPVLNVRDLNLRYGADQARAPKLKEATFNVPLGTTQATYERVRDQHIGKWLHAMQAKGWDPCLDSQHRIQIYPAIYPAPDLQTGLSDLGSREFRVRAWFQFRDPKPLRLEIEPELLQPVRAAGT